MAIKDVVTGGFGSFSSVNKIPTRGFSIGAAITVDAASIHYRVESDQPHYRPESDQVHYRSENA